MERLKDRLPTEADWEVIYWVTFVGWLVLGFAGMVITHEGEGMVGRGLAFGGLGLLLLVRAVMKQDYAR